MFVKYILVVCLMFAVIECDKKSKMNITTKIVGGTRKKIDKLPYMVSIKLKQSARLCVCGGSILNELWVLTAGHCMSDPSTNSSEKLVVLVGSTKCYHMKEIDYQIIDVDRLYLHPKYSVIDGQNPSYDYNDIGLISLKKKIQFGPKVQPVLLLTTRILKGKLPHEKFNTNCIASGWGMLNMSGKKDSHLYQVELPLMDINKCEKYYQRSMIKLIFDKSKAVCTMEPKGGKDVCSGDSGGPLVCNGVQVGVVSMGFGCALQGVPNVWTRVDMYVNWIQEVINSTKWKEIKYKSRGNIIEILFYKLLITVILEKYLIF